MKGKVNDSSSGGEIRARASQSGRPSEMSRLPNEHSLSEALVWRFICSHYYTLCFAIRVSTKRGCLSPINGQALNSPKVRVADDQGVERFRSPLRRQSRCFRTLLRSDGRCQGSSVVFGIRLPDGVHDRRIEIVLARFDSWRQRLSAVKRVRWRPYGRSSRSLWHAPPSPKKSVAPVMSQRVLSFLPILQV